MADSDSENEGILNNIQRLVIRPPGHTGKAKKGHICFDGGYETMNLGRVDFITNQEYDLFIRPDTANPRARLWFHFTVENTQKDQRVIFNVVNLSKWRTLFTDGLTPVVKSTSRPRWQRMQRQFVFYYRSPIHSDHFVLSFAFSFDREDERYSFALAQPYSLSRYNLYIESVLAGKHVFLHCETIGHSIQERPLHLITITGDPEQKAAWPPKKRIIFIMGRVHASEAPSSFILQGLIDFLSSNHSVAKDLRRHLIFKLVPVMNPDGVFLGNTMGNLLGQDLNRCWMEPNQFSQPTVYTIRKLIHALDKDPVNTLDMIIDVHSHISLLGLFIVGNSYSDVYRFERHVVFPKIMAQICPDFSLENTMYNDDEAKAGTARRYFCSAVSPEVNSFTLEASLYGYVDPESDPLLPIVVPYTDDMYCRIGRNLARAMWDYYKILNVIPLEDHEGLLGQQSNSTVRSFNLLRLRAIEDQRNQTAITFDSENYQENLVLSSRESRANDPPLEPGWTTASRGRRIDVGRTLSPTKVHLSLKTIVYSEQDLRSEERAYVYEYDGAEADDEADFDDLLSMSMFEVDSPSTASNVSPSIRETHSWTPSAASSSRPVGGQQQPVRVHLKAGHHSRDYLRMRSSGRRSAAGGSPIIDPALSIRGQNCANGPPVRFVCQ